MARIDKSCVTEEHTPVDALKELHDPDVIVKLLNVCPVLVHVCASDDEPEVTV